MRLRLIVAAALVGIFVPALALAAGASSSGPAVVAKLTGGAEVPKGDPNGKGHATIHLDAKKGKVCWSFTYSGIDKPNAAHIHEAEKGKAGAVVVPLGKAFARKGCVSADKSEIKSILKRPGEYYVNIHNAKYPGGALRGQLKKGKA